MADIRFKLCGDNPPFLINIHEGISDSDPLICSTTLEFTGATTTLTDGCYTCAIISGLKGETNYYVCSVNTVGACTESVFNTPPNLTPPPPIVKTISLGGTTTSTSTTQTLTGNKNLITTPNLESGESYEVEFLLDTVANGGFRSTTSSAILYKSENGGASFNELTRVSDGNDENIWVSIGLNDVICYDLFSEISTAGSNTASASIEILGTRNVVGIDTLNIGSSNELSVSRSIDVTTTTTTTESTIDVYFNGAAVTQPLTGSMDLKKYRPVIFNNLDPSQTASVDLFVNGTVFKTNGLDFSTITINYRTNSSDSFTNKDLIMFTNKTENNENKTKTLTFNGITNTDDLEIQLIIDNNGDNSAVVELILTNPQLTVLGTGPNIIQITKPNPPNFSDEWSESVGNVTPE